MITEVLPRLSKLSRPATIPGQRVFEQIIVSNADLVIPVFAAANPPPKWGLLDRYLVSAEASGLPALICITKLDLVTGSNGEMDTDLLEAVQTYRQIGYSLVLTSALTGEGLDELRTALNGRISALVGKSGVGKTSLLNALQPGLGLRVNQVHRVRNRETS